MAPTACDHESLLFTPAPSAARATYTQPTIQQRFTAATGKRKRDGNSDPTPSTFPAPLVLPGDELALDPRYPGQTFQSWLKEDERNEVSEERCVIYIAAPPKFEAAVEHARTWTVPRGDQVTAKSSRISHMAASRAPNINDIIEQLSSFYHGLEVMRLPEKLVFTEWEEGKPRKGHHDNIGLSTSTDCTRIRVRGRGTDQATNVFPYQLNLNDILDVAISILPSNAYALLMLVEHDLFEDDEDDFACGRAYGGSRIAVVSMARYDPQLDELQGVERLHAWPASHCKTYIYSMCKTASDNAAGSDSKEKRKRKHGEKLEKETEAWKPGSDASALKLDINPSAMQAATSAHPANQFTELTLSGLSSLYLLRVVRTAAHELGHCFGLDHCVYYACVMQGTASLAEDVRQPPYLCPVCLAKLGRAIAGKKEQDVKAWERRRYEATLEACGAVTARGDDVGFGALGAWVGAVLDESNVV